MVYKEVEDEWEEWLNASTESSEEEPYYNDHDGYEYDDSSYEYDPYYNDWAWVLWIWAMMSMRILETLHNFPLSLNQCVNFDLAKFFFKYSLLTLIMQTKIDPTILEQQLLIWDLYLMQWNS